ncbi:hypothetical protein E4T56_gene13502 [Termitomyces sp. T112]|nr:hypothetical protein E4T56_gene13502 [Termitomyces sp. T112]
MVHQCLLIDLHVQVKYCAHASYTPTPTANVRIAFGYPLGPHCLWASRQSPGVDFTNINQRFSIFSQVLPYLIQVLLIHSDSPRCEVSLRLNHSPIGSAVVLTCSRQSPPTIQVYQGPRRLLSSIAPRARIAQRATRSLQVCPLKFRKLRLRGICSAPHIHPIRSDRWLRSRCFFHQPLRSRKELRSYQSVLPGICCQRFDDAAHDWHTEHQTQVLFKRSTPTHPVPTRFETMTDGSVGRQISQLVGWQTISQFQTGYPLLHPWAACSPARIPERGIVHCLATSGVLPVFAASQGVPPHPEPNSNSASSALLG